MAATGYPAASATSVTAVLAKLTSAVLCPSPSKPPSMSAIDSITVPSASSAKSRVGSGLARTWPVGEDREVTLISCDWTEVTPAGILTAGLTSTSRWVGNSSVMTKFCCVSCHRTTTSCPMWGKSAKVYSPLMPRKNSCPKVVTVTVARANSTPSASARTVWEPSPSLFQLNNSPKPLFVSPHTPCVSVRRVP